MKNLTRTRTAKLQQKKIKFSIYIFIGMDLVILAVIDTCNDLDQKYLNLSKVNHFVESAIYLNDVLAIVPIEGCAHDFR